MSTVVEADRKSFRTVRVRDPNGHRNVLLDGVKPSDTMTTIRARAMSELRLTEEVDWNIRDDRQGRLLRDDQRLDEVDDGTESEVNLTMQPDAGLG